MEKLLRTGLTNFLFTIGAFLFAGAGLANDTSPAEDFDRLLSLTIANDDLIVAFQNDTGNPVHVLDTLMLANEKLPPILRLKVLDFSDITPENFDRLAAQSEWIMPPRYHAYIFAISKQRIEIAPGEFIS